MDKDMPEQSNATYESRRSQLEREIPDLERYVEVLKAELSNLITERTKIDEFQTPTSVKERRSGL